MTIDERIVKLGLNNNNFEKHAEESLRTLDKLDKSLNSFGEAVGFDKLGGLIDTVTHRFSALGIAGDQVIRNLTNQVMNLVGQMGKLAKSMSIDQIGEGFSKYGEKTEAVQTIMAATAKDWDDQGAQMEYVNDQLEKLNWFTDETSYSFLDMVNNIGKFTSNGFGLEESVTAMEGISTWAAISGAKVSEAGRAMYNLSQAMATGSVKLIDWKSIENANMATREFKETALEIAVELGTLKKNADGSFTVVKNQAEEADKALTKTKKKAESVAKTFTTEQFNTELSTGWFSKDVLMKTLQQYGRFTDILNQASEASGMTASQIIHEIDAYKQGSSVVSELTPYIKELASAENDLGFRAFKAAQEAKTFQDAIQATKDAVSTGWMNLWEKVFGNYLEAKKLWTDIAESFYNIFAEPVNKLNEIFDIAFGGNMPNNATKTAKRVDVLSSHLSDAGKTTKDLENAFSKIDDIRLEALVSQYGSLEEAINRGAVSAELLKKILGELNIGEEVADEVMQADVSVTSFGDRLAKTGRSMEDLEHAVLAVSDRAALDMIENYGGVEEALKKGAISADLFREALQYMAGESSDSAEAVGEDLSKLSGHLEDYRKVALEVLRGDWDNGEARRKALEEAGYDYEMIQWLAGNLQAYGYEVSDDFLLSLDKTEEVRKAFEQLAINAGYTTEEIAAMNEMLDNSEAILGDIQIEAKQIDRSAEKLDLAKGGELFRESLMNILHGIEGVADAISQAFDLVFGGSEDADEAIMSFGAKLNDLIKRFHDFTSGLVMNEEQIEKLRDRIAGVFRVINTVASTIGTVVKTAVRLAGRVFNVVVPVIGIILESINSLYDRLNRNGTFVNFANGLKNIFEGLSAAGKVVYDNITGIFKYFRTVSGMKEFSFIKTLGDWLSILGVRFEAATYEFKEFMSSAETTRKIEAVFLKVFNVLKSLKNLFSSFIDTVAPVFSVISQAISDVINKIKMFGTSMLTFKDGETIFTKFGSAIQSAIGWISSGLGAIKDAIQDAFGKDGGVTLASTLSTILKAFLGFTAIKGIGKVFSGLGSMLGGIGSIGEFLNNPVSVLTNAIQGFKDAGGLSGIFGGLFGKKDESDSFLDTAEKVVSMLKTLGIALLMIVVATYAFSKINIEKALLPMVTVFSSLGTILAVLSKYTRPKDLIASAGALAILGFGLILIAGALGVVSLIPADKMTSTLLTLVTMLAAMGLALAILSKPEYANTGRMAAAAASLLILSNALVVVAVALGIIALIPANKLTNILLALGVSLAAMAVVLAILSKPEYANPGGMIAAAFSLLLVAAAMAVVAVAIAALGIALKINESSIIAFIGIIAVMGIALAALGALGPIVLAAGAAFLLAGVGFVAIAAGMAILGIALRMIEGLHVVKIAGQLLVLAIPLMLLGAAGVVFGLGGIGLALGGAGLLVLATALRAMNGVKVAPDYLLMLGGALMALGVAGFVFGLGGIGLITGGLGMIALAAGLRIMNGVSIAPDYLLALGGALMALGIAGVIFGVGSLGLLTGGIGLIALGVGLRSMTGIDIKPDWLLGLAGALIVFGIAGGFLTAGALGLLAGAPALAALGEALVPLANGLSAMQSVSLNDLGKTFIALSEGIAALFALQFATILNGVPVLRELANTMPQLAIGFRSFELLNGEAISMACTGLSKAIGSLFKLQFSTIRDGTPQLQALGRALPTIANGFNSFKDIDAGWLASMSKSLDSALSTLTNGGIFSKKRDYSSIVDLGNALSVFWSGMSNFVGIDIQSPVTLITTVLSDMQDAVSQSLPAFEMKGSEVSGAFAIGVKKGLPYITASFASVPSGLSSIMRAYTPVWEILGGNISIGLANGIYRESSKAVRAANSLASSVQNTVRNVLGVHSPSRVMAEIGGYVSIGLGEGIRSESDYIEESMIVAISPALAAINALADSDFSISPTIAPVVDLSNVDSAAGSVNGMFGKANLGALNRVTAEQAERYSSYAPVIAKDESVVNELQSLSSRMDALGEAITNMQIVLDSGQLVGSTSAKMDARLGVLAARKGRGN